MTRFTDDDEGVKSGNLYFSALINVESQPQGNVYVMAFVPRTKKSVIAAGSILWNSADSSSVKAPATTK